MSKGKPGTSAEPKPKLPATCLVDTNFLINLANPAEANHKNAQEYLELLKSVGTVFILSAVVEAEFENGSMASVIAVLGPQQVRRIPFDHTEAQQARTLKARHERVRGGKKQAHLLDMMIVAQASKRNVEAVITGDRKMISFLAEVGIKALDLNVKVSEFMLASSPLYGGSDLRA